MPDRVAVRSRSGWSDRWLGSWERSGTRRSGTTGKTEISAAVAAAVWTVCRALSSVTSCSEKGVAPVVWARPAVACRPQYGVHYPAVDPGPVAAVDFPVLLLLL